MRNRWINKYSKYGLLAFTKVKVQFAMIKAIITDYEFKFRKTIHRHSKEPKRYGEDVSIREHENLQRLRKSAWGMNGG